MNDQQLEERLRAWYHASPAASETASHALRARVVAVPEATLTTAGFVESLFGPRRSWSLIVAMLLLLGLAIAFTVAVGSGLIKLPWNDRAVVPLPSPTSTPLPGDTTPPPTLAPNPSTPAEGCSRIDSPVPAYGRVVTWEQRTYHVAVLQDGRWLTWYDRTEEQVRTGDPAITVSRLVEHWPSLLQGIVGSTGLVAPGCHLDHIADDPWRTIEAWAFDGSYGVTHMGTYIGFEDPLTEAEQTAADEMQVLFDSRLYQPRPIEWVQAEPTAYVPSLWNVEVELRSGEDGALPEPDPRSPRTVGPQADSLLLPDGTPLVEFGRYSFSDGNVIDHRCANVDPALAQEYVSWLNDAGGVVHAQSWWFGHAGGVVSVSVDPLFPWEFGCSAGPLQRPDPKDLNPCELIVKATVGREGTGSERTFPGHAMPSWDGDGCALSWDDSWERKHFLVRRKATTLEEAAALLQRPPEATPLPSQPTSNQGLDPLWQMSWQSHPGGGWVAEGNGWHAFALSIDPYFFVVTEGTEAGAISLGLSIAALLGYPDLPNQQ